MFIGVCFPIQSPSDFFTLLESHQDLNATHNCWAYRAGSEYRFNDDGEPSGTAGKPILAAIDGADFNYVGALVIRHYGGIKLGTGGLARAYGGIIARNLQQSEYTFNIPMSEFSVQIPFEYNQQVFKITAEFNGSLINQTFNVDGVLCEVSIPEDQTEPFRKTLTNVTKGQAIFMSEIA